LSHIVITEPGDDGLDWDQGWRGRAQFVVVQLGPERGQNAIEADNLQHDPGASPRSAPHLSHVTLLGSRTADVAHRAMVLRRGTAGRLENVLIGGFQLGVADIGDEVTAREAEAGRLALGPGATFDVGDDGLTAFPEEPDDDGGYDEAGLPTDLESLARPLAVGPPTFAPRSGVLPLTGATTLPEDEFWDAAATWFGAVRPGADESWLTGWTAFPEN
ncbi:MAG: hypothetical protein AAF602_16390, partial [Myxococcota bacterium]